MTKLLLLLFVFTGMVLASSITGKDKMENNISDISVMDMNGDTVKLSSYSGKVLLIVNVASKCGNTPQYEDLEEIYKTYKSKGFEILAFPCNDFGNQEPSSNEEIKNFCTTNYGVTFKLFDKINVKGDNKVPLYKKLTDNSITGTSEIKWNFEKFLVSKDGSIVARFPTKVKPTDSVITDFIEKELK